MAWYWWILLIVGYVLGGVYFGTRFRQWGRHTLCTNRYEDGGMCGGCSDSTIAGAILWPVLPPLIMLITWLYRTARRQSQLTPEGRKQAKLRTREETARLEREAIEAERKSTDAKLQLTLKKQELLHAQALASTDDGFAQPAFIPHA
jgi:hypothetical protein